MVGAFRVPKIQVSQRTVGSFVTGSDAIPVAGNATLNATLADLIANANATVLIEGFTDSVGRSANNRGLSLRRARAVQAFFIANGINVNRIAIVGRGETNFVAPNNTEAGRGRNRRIVMTVHRPVI
jgi:outer membrane protein OmpA-like peptidoglycan-associated protein